LKYPRKFIPGFFGKKNTKKIAGKKIAEIFGKKKTQTRLAGI